MEKADVEEKCHMKRKVIVIAGVLLAAIIAITVFMRMMGGSGDLPPAPKAGGGES